MSSGPTARRKNPLIKKNEFFTIPSGLTEKITLLWKHISIRPAYRSNNKWNKYNSFEKLSLWLKTKSFIKFTIIIAMQLILNIQNANYRHESMNTSRIDLFTVIIIILSVNIERILNMILIGRTLKFSICGKWLQKIDLRMSSHKNRSKYYQHCDRYRPS